MTVHLDWNGGVELISAIPGATTDVAASVSEFVKRNGDGVYTSHIHVPGASDAEAITERYGSKTRFRQGFSGEGWWPDGIDLLEDYRPTADLAVDQCPVTTDSRGEIS